MWCDDFDADLPKVVPGAMEALGEMADLPLATFSRLTAGTINCPSSWWTDAGLTSFFWTSPHRMPPACYVTDNPEVECTFGEAVRDEWVHSAAICVDQVLVWTPPERHMETLMYDLRGWTVLGDRQRERIREQVRRSLAAAARHVAEVTGKPAAHARKEG